MAIMGMGSMLFEGPRKRMENLYDNSPSRKLTDSDRIVIFSDMHMGNKGRADDFRENGAVFKTAMDSRYLPGDFEMVMNGDIEELHKFRLRTVMRKWERIFGMFYEMDDRGSLMKIYGNHDHHLWHLGNENRLTDLMTESLKFRYGSDTIFLFHGHQASLRAESMEKWIHLGLKYGASPMGMRNYSWPQESTLRFNIEKRAYDFSRERKIISIIGHTHRPLFESMSRADTLKYKIENLLRDYPASTGDRREKIEKDIRKYNTELEHIMSHNPKLARHESLYNQGVVVPCLFNSGTCIGKKGITAIEIDEGRISLVYWFDSDRTTKYFNYNGYVPEKVEGTSIYRVVLKEEDLSYIFSRINLLA